MKNNQPNAPLSKKVGNKIEDVGHKISKAGADRLGSFVTKVGSKIEHANDPKPAHANDKTKKNK